METLLLMFAGVVVLASVAIDQTLRPDVTVSHNYNYWRNIIGMIGIVLTLCGLIGWLA